MSGEVSDSLCSSSLIREIGFEWHLLYVAVFLRGAMAVARCGATDDATKQRWFGLPGSEGIFVETRPMLCF